MKTTLLPVNPGKNDKISIPKSMCILAGCILAAIPAQSQVMTDITALSSVRTNGTYTYYAEQTSGTASDFTTLFYPGPTNHDAAANTSDNDGTLNDATSTPAPISIGTGELTDYSGGLPNNSTYVSGWVGTTSYLGNSTSAFPGTFDVLFNLGSVYSNIDEIVINYTDAAGHRYVTTANAQSIYYGLTAPNTTSTGGLTLFGSSTITAGGTQANMTISSATPVSAQYIDLRLDVNVAGAGNFGSVGGYINSVQILAVPEPETLALIALIVPILWMVRRSRRHSVALRMDPASSHGSGPWDINKAVFLLHLLRNSGQQKSGRS